VLAFRRPCEHSGTSSEGLYPAEVLFAPDGKYAYVSVRDATDAKRDAVAIFSVAAPAAAAPATPSTTAGTATSPASASTATSEASISLRGHVSTGHYPRSMSLDASGRLLIVANQKGKSLSSYWRNASSGWLTPAKQPPVAMPDSPAFVMIL
jgi:6-phosphogluconolactonase (cycloisomerase 2 family)